MRVSLELQVELLSRVLRATSAEAAESEGRQPILLD